MKTFITKNLLAAFANLTGIGVIEWLSNIDINELIKLISQGVLAIIAIIHFIKAQKVKTLNDKSKNTNG